MLFRKTAWMMVSTGALVTSALSFQNCSKTAFNGSSSSTSASVETSASCGPLCGITINDINRIQFIASVTPVSSDGILLEVDTTVNSSSETLNSTVSVKAELNNVGVNVGSCSVTGTNVDFDALATNLSAITVATTQNSSASSAAANFASATLNVALKNGTTISLVINTATNSVSVSGTEKVDAIALLNQLTSIVLSSSCASNLPL